MTDSFPFFPFSWTFCSLLLDGKIKEQKCRKIKNPQKKENRNRTGLELCVFVCFLVCFFVIVSFSLSDDHSTWRWEYWDGSWCGWRLPAPGSAKSDYFNAFKQGYYLAINFKNQFFSQKVTLRGRRMANHTAQVAGELETVLKRPHRSVSTSRHCRAIRWRRWAAFGIARKCKLLNRSRGGVH